MRPKPLGALVGSPTFVRRRDQVSYDSDGDVLYLRRGERQLALGLFELLLS